MLHAVFICFLCIEAGRTEHAATVVMAVAVHLATTGFVALMLILARPALGDSLIRPQLTAIWTPR